MNKYKEYYIEKVSTQDIDNIIEEYLDLSEDQGVRKMNLKLSGSKLILYIEKYSRELNTDLIWEKIERLIKEIKLEGKEIYFWFRDDDVGQFTPSLKTFLDYFQRNKLHVLLAVIPSLVDRNCALELQKYKDLIVVGQHGYSHINYSGEKEEPNEFDSSRKETDVIKEVRTGREKLKKLFGNEFLDVFIPPWFEIDSKMYDLIEEKVGYRYFSIFWKNQRKNTKTIEINSQIDLVNWDKYSVFGGEKFVLAQLKSELEEVKRSDRRRNAIGILFHHERTERETYNFIDELIKRIEKHKNIKISNIEEVIDIVKDLK